MSNGLQPHFTREYLHIKPVQQAPNPFIPNEADRIFVPKDDPVIKFARSLQSYNPNLKDWADREEGRLMEEARSQTMEELYQNGGLDHVKEKYFQNPNMDGINPYLHRELGKEVLKLKAIQYNAALKLAYDEGNWSALEPKEFHKNLTEHRGKWTKENEAELTMADSRDYPEIFDKIHESTMMVVSEGYYREKAKKIQKFRKSVYQEGVLDDIESGYDALVKIAEKDEKSLYRDFNIDDIAGFDSYSKLKTYLKDKYIYTQFLDKRDHYIKNLGLDEDEAYAFTLEAFEYKASSGEGNSDVYIAMAGLWRDDAEKRNENKEVISTVMDKAEFGAWAEATKRKGTIAYQERSAAEASKYEADLVRSKTKFLQGFYQYFGKEAEKSGNAPLSPEKMFADLGVPPNVQSFANGILSSYQSAPDRVRTDDDIRNRLEVMLKIDDGGYKTISDLKADIDTLHINDHEAAYGAFAANNGKQSRTSQMIQASLAQVKTSLSGDGFGQNDINVFGSEIKRKMLLWIDDRTSKGETPSELDIETQVIIEADKLRQDKYWEQRFNKLVTNEWLHQTNNYLLQTTRDDTLTMKDVFAFHSNPDLKAKFVQKWVDKHGEKVRPYIDSIILNSILADPKNFAKHAMGIMQNGSDYVLQQELAPFKQQMNKGLIDSGYPNFTEGYAPQENNRDE